jgi:hypothetical protein
MQGGEGTVCDPRAVGRGGAIAVPEREKKEEGEIEGKRERKKERKKKWACGSSNSNSQ